MPLLPLLLLAGPTYTLPSKPGQPGFSIAMHGAYRPKWPLPGNRIEGGLFEAKGSAAHVIAIRKAEPRAKYEKKLARALMGKTAAGVTHAKGQGVNWTIVETALKGSARAKPAWDLTGYAYVGNSSLWVSAFVPGDRSNPELKQARAMILSLRPLAP